MTDAEKITMLTQMTDETDSDVLSTYLLLARYDAIHVEVAAYMLNKRGAEGETVHLENGVSRHWEDGSIPPSLLRRIVPNAGVLT